MVLLRFLELEFCSVWMNCTVFNVALEHCCYIYWTDSGRSQTFLLFSGITSNLFCSSLILFFINHSSFWFLLIPFYWHWWVEARSWWTTAQRSRWWWTWGWTFMCSLSLFLHNGLHLDFPNIALGGLFTGW